MKNMRIVLSGGGTGGHIYPAVAIANQCRQEEPDTELLYIGTRNGLEYEIVKKAEIPFSEIEISGFRRKLFTRDHVKTMLRFVRAVRQCKKLLREFKPDVVIGTGGFVCGPVIYAAAKLGIPTLIHEQNVIPGLTNRFLSRYADSVAVSFKGSESAFKKAKRAVYTGNPSASQVMNADPQRALRTLGIPDKAQVVLITGGSRGARALNDAALQMLALVGDLPDVFIVWVTGSIYYEAYKEKSKSARASERVKIAAYLHNMPEVLASSLLVISRAGASFLAEVTALGVPSVLVPSPNVTNNHQEANARWLSKEKAAELILEKDLNGERLFSVIQAIMADPIRREYMSKQAKKLGQADAAKLVYRELKNIVD